MKFLNKNYMILGNINVLNDIAKNYEVQQYIILEMDSDYDQKYNTIYLKEEKLQKKTAYYVINGLDEIVKTGTISYKEIFIGLEVSEKFINQSKEQLGKDFAKSLIGYVPLFYLCFNIDKKNSYIIEYYSQLRYSEADIIFIKTNEKYIMQDENIDESKVNFNTLLCTLVEKHRENALFLGNHQCYYRKENSSKEIEYKFNVLGDANLWNIIVEMYKHFKTHNFKDFILEYKDEIQKWDYMNYMFEVLGSEQERGYISFIPQTNGKELIKRKIYSKDQLSRTEMLFKDNVVDSPRAEYLAKRFGVKAYEFPPFRRVRYDINVESLKSGNVHGIFLDYITVEGSDLKLMQCEIEYLRTRSLEKNDSYMEELILLKNYVIDYFNKNNIEYIETFYSKLSFMKDVLNGGN